MNPNAPEKLRVEFVVIGMSLCVEECAQLEVALAVTVKSEAWHLRGYDVPLRSFLSVSKE